MAIDRASSGLQYPERFYVAASYAGFDGSPRSSSKAVRAKFNSESALILYALYKQGGSGAHSGTLRPFSVSCQVLSTWI
ncbi:acyl-CoA-binding domain-containing protein 4-like isoform X2 [Rosa rugosa]|uniref:acyl-CoA-binding domain-containing protein 4-like isoform X2 n=1 Tax=Rosa rugosa TaxID=74645 RepID=UPI002B40AF5C|nr:acyl-CoA-binding domain-containing protein 4-like isoform X2 [Rosa rugosa]